MKCLLCPREDALVHLESHAPPMCVECSARNELFIAVAPKRPSSKDDLEVMRERALEGALAWLRSEGLCPEEMLREAAKRLQFGAPAPAAVTRDEVSDEALGPERVREFLAACSAENELRLELLERGVRSADVVAKWPGGVRLEWGWNHSFIHVWLLDARWLVVRSGSRDGMRSSEERVSFSELERVADSVASACEAAELLADLDAAASLSTMLDANDERNRRDR